MEQLSLHIEYLLLRNDCVIVPGFGAFIATRKSARFDVATHIITPPSREIGFNRAVVSDDGLLAHSIARRERISFEDARLSMLRSIDDLKERLINTGEVNLKHIGILTLGEENTIIFNPHGNGKSQAEIIGHRPVALVATGKESATAEETPKENLPAATDHDKSERPAEEKESIHETSTGTKRESTRYYTFRIRRSYAHIAASILLVAVAMISLLIPAADRKNPEPCLASVVPVEKISKSVSEVANHAAGAATASKAGSAKDDSDVDTEEKSESIAPYYLIVATFRTRDEADRYIRESSDRVELTCVEGGKLSRVAIAGAEDKSELQRKLNEDTFKKRYPGAWIWKSK